MGDSPTQTSAGASNSVPEPSTSRTDEPSPAQRLSSISRKPIPIRDRAVSEAQASQRIPDDVEHVEAPPPPYAEAPPPVPARRTASGSGSLFIDTTPPVDFDDVLPTNNELPASQTINMIENYIVLDRHGKTHPFKSLYTGDNVARRVLVIFIRHFFCGSSQQFLSLLSDSVTPEQLLRLPVSTFIVVIGCGAPAMIENYVERTGCRFPVYTDPTRSLFEALGMSKTFAMGSRPAYMRKSMPRTWMETVVQGIKQIPTGNILKSGDQRQVGGEFLFEPRELDSPVHSPTEHAAPRVGAFEERNEWPGRDERGGHRRVNEEKRVTWCHRMKTTRDHAEIPELMEVLGLDRKGGVILPKKGVGLSMANEMRKLSADRGQSSLTDLS